MTKRRKLKNMMYQLMRVVPDSVYVRLKYRKNFGKLPNLRNPQTFNEKLNWLKLYDRNQHYTTLVDKHEVKQYVADVIGGEYVIPTIGVWESAEEIDFDSLPDKFVMKATHDSGGVVICRDKSKLDREAARKKMSEALQRDFYAVTREWPYKNVKRRIIAEQLLEVDGDTTNGSINDYKFFCFNGKVRFMKVDVDRDTDHRANYYDTKFHLLNFTETRFGFADKPVEKPVHFEKMIELAEKLAKDKRFLRVDFYEVGDRLYFGEITFFPDSGVGRFTPESADDEIGAMLQL